MKNLKKSLIIGASLLAFTSCKKDDNTTNSSNQPAITTVEQDKASLDNSSDEIINCLNSFTEGEFVTQVEELAFLEEDEEWTEEMFDSLAVKLNEDIYEELDNNLKFRYDLAKGEYTYNSTTKSWTTSSSNVLTLNFPSTEGGSNDMKLSLTNYADQVVVHEGETASLPTAVELSITKNTTTLLSISLKDTEWGEVAKEMLPKTHDLTVFLNPITLTSNVDLSLGTVITANFGVAINNCSYTVAPTITLKHSNYESLTEEDVVNVKATVGFNNLSITADAKVSDILALEDSEAETSIDDINDLVDVSMSNNGQPMGTLLLEKGEEDIQLMIEFKDGQKEDFLVNYVEPFIESLEEELSQFEEEEDDALVYYSRAKTSLANRKARK